MPSEIAASEIGQRTIKGTTWLYEGRTGGWWKYDPETNQKLEQGYQVYISKAKDASFVENSILGSEDSFIDLNAQMSIMIMDRGYLIDFEQMTQTPNTQIGITRHIKRIDVGDDNLMIKGVAGLQAPKPAPLINLYEIPCATPTQENVSILNLTPQNL